MPVGVVQFGTPRAPGEGRRLGTPKALIEERRAHIG